MSETKIYAFVVGYMPKIWQGFKLWRASRAALRYIQSLEGFLFCVDFDTSGIACFFNSENNAKGARNLSEAYGICAGKNILSFDVVCPEQRREP